MFVVRKGRVWTSKIDTEMMLSIDVGVFEDIMGFVIMGRLFNNRSVTVIATGIRDEMVVIVLDKMGTNKELGIWKSLVNKVR